MGEGDGPLRAPSSLATTRRSPRTSSFNLPVSLCFSSSYSSSFSSWRTRVRCVSAAVTVVVEPPAVAPAAASMCGRSTDSRAGGNVTGSAVDGPGCFTRYCRRTVISSWRDIRYVIAIYRASALGAAPTYCYFSQLGILFSEESFELELAHVGKLHERGRLG